MISANKIKAALNLKWISRNPQTYNQKIQFKAAWDRRDELTLFADKIKVRNYVEKIVGSEILTRLYLVTYNLESINWTKIPREFVFKVNHGSKGAVIVTEKADIENVLPKNLEDESWTLYRIHPDSLNKEDLVQLGKHWLKLDYEWWEDCGRMPEWAYKKIKPGALFEELLIDPGSDKLPDYKFHIFNGKCLFVNVIHRNLKSQKTQEIRNFSNVMSPNWEKINLILNNNLPMEVPISKPKKFDTMVEIAEKLSQNIDFVRVDLYSIGEKIFFGELTNYPSAGLNSFNPEEFDLRFGQKWKIDDYGFLSRFFAGKVS